MQRDSYLVNTHTHTHTHTHPSIPASTWQKHWLSCSWRSHTLIVLLMTESERLSITWEHHSSRPHSIPPRRHTDIIGVHDPWARHSYMAPCRGAATVGFNLSQIPNLLNVHEYALDQLALNQDVFVIHNIHPAEMLSWIFAAYPHKMFRFHGNCIFLLCFCCVLLSRDMQSAHGRKVAELHPIHDQLFV